ncbi:MAG: MFS transporter [Caulobacteraceae bacterium]|nr:MFS transporter [Caulobacteraceae bacterium]
MVAIGAAPTSAATQETSAYPARRYAAGVVAVLFLANFVSYMDRQVILVMVPALRAGLRVNDTEVSLLGGIGTAALYAVAGIPLGWLADRTNRRNMIALAIAGWSLATVACGLASNFWELFVARMLVGLGEACLTPAAFSLIVDCFAPPERGRAIALMQAGIPLGSGGAMFVGGLLLSAFASGAFAGIAPAGWPGWKLLFIVYGLPGLLLAALVAALREPVRRELADAKVVDHPLWPFLRRHAPAIGLMCLLYASYSSIGFCINNWLPTLLMRIHHFSQAGAGAVSGMIIIFSSVPAFASAGFVSDLLYKLRGVRGRALAPMLLAPFLAAALAWLTLAPETTSTLVASFVALALVSLSSTTIWPAMQAILPNRLRGQVMAVALLIASLVGLGGAPTLVAVVSDYVFHDEMMLQVAVGVVCLGIVAIVLAAALTLPRFYVRTHHAVAEETAAAGAEA